VIDRYTRPELGGIWTDEARMETWRQVEVAAAEELDGPTDEEREAIRNATFTVEAVRERELVTEHDMAAFVDVLAQSAGEAGRWIHYGLTSSDVLDTALALQLRAAGEPIVAGARDLVRLLATRAREHRGTLCVGRTHGIHAEPTTFGIKLAGFAFEAHRNAQRLERAFQQVAFGAISGAVGTYASLGPEFEERVLARLGLAVEPVSTQVVPRDRHADLLQAIALAGAGLERFATEVRHLQRTEVAEVSEPFRAGAQKGSSAMPHKRNPIISERICGLARVLRGNATAAVENIALWHERDISHSSAERVILPDSTILIDYMQSLAIRVVDGMVVDAQRMRQNLELTHGALFSQRILLALVAAGMARDEAYRIVQEASQRAWDERRPLRSLLEETEGDEAWAAPDVAPLEELDLDAIFDYGHFTRYAGEIIARLDTLI
jgi:adenylosuccinate lyase